MRKRGIFMFKFSTKKLVRAGLIAALYAAITYVFAPYAYGPFQIRPAEALCILPLFFVEAVPGLFVGCALANLLSQYGAYDVIFGSITTLVAALITYAIGKLLKEKPLSVILGGIPPIILNALCIPLIIALTGAGMGAYLTLVAEFLLTETVWVYALGIPLYFAIKRLGKSVKFFRSEEYEEELKNSEGNIPPENSDDKTV